MLSITFAASNLRTHIAGNSPEYPETSPELHVYVSSELYPEVLGNQRQVFVINERDIGKEYTLEIPNVKEMRPSSSLVISMFAKSKEGNRPYLVPCGTARMLIPYHIIGKSLPVRFKVDIVDPHCQSPVKKADLDFVIRNFVYTGNKVVTAQKWMNTPDEEDYWDERTQNYAKKALWTYLNSEQEIKFGVDHPKYKNAQKFVPSNTLLECIHCPYYQTEFYGLRLPGFAYSWIYPRTDPNEAFFVNIVRKSLEMYEMDESEFLGSISKQFAENSSPLPSSFMKAVNSVGGACCIYSQAQLYVLDHINQYRDSVCGWNSGTYIKCVENMNNLRVTHGNDCEDKAQDSAITAMSFKNFAGWTHPLTIACKMVVEQYCVLMCTGAASTASAQETRSGTEKDPSTFICHIFCLLIPSERLGIMLDRTNTDRSLVGIKRNKPAWNKELDILFCEGTGRESPTYRPEWEWSGESRDLYISRYIEQDKFEKENSNFALYDIIQKKYIAHPKDVEDYDDFYRFLVSAYIPKGQGSQIADITFVYPDTGRYGIYIHDLIYDRSNPGVVINEIIEPDEISHIEDVLNIAHPVPQPVPRPSDLVYRDIQFLEETLRLKPWIPEIPTKNKLFGYFFSIEELQGDHEKLNFTGNYRTYYKYYGLDVDTCYIELCFYQS